MPNPSDEEARIVFEKGFLEELRSRAAMLLADHGPEAREDGVQELVCQAWQIFLSAWTRDQADRITPFTLALYSYRHYRAGRRFAGSGRLDAMSDLSRAKGKVKLIGIEETNRSPCQDHCEVVRWKLDLAAMIRSLTARQRLVLALTAAGWRNGEIASQLGVSPSRVTQIMDQVGVAFMKAGYGPAESVQREEKTCASR